LTSFSDGVFAVLITILVLELHVPRSPSVEAFLEIWPSIISYGVSYFFIAIVWINHHHLLKYADEVSPRIIWANFGHLFSASLIPFATAWMDSTRIAPLPVALYAAVFVGVNITYILLCRELIDIPDHPDVAHHDRRAMRLRSYGTLLAFLGAGVVGLWLPLLGLAIILICLITYVTPDLRARRLAT
jgi:uncharacterized membrane protein